MKKLIDYLMKFNWYNLPVSEVVGKLKQRFIIVNYQGEPATEELVDTIIFWEKHSEIYNSLEKTLNDKFILK